jgi:MipA family protein
MTFAIALVARRRNTHFARRHPAPAARLRSSTIFAALSACIVSISAAAQTATKKDEGPWSVSVGLFAISTPEYEGGKRRVNGVLPDFDISYKTQDWGKFGVGSKSRGVSWTILDKEEYSFGILLGADTGRSEKEGTAFRPGSKRLRGLGEIKSAGEVGVFGHVVFGVPLSLQVTRGLGDEEPDSKNLSIKGHRGTRIEFGSEIPFKLTDTLTLSVSPSVSWADKNYTQTYFGVTSAQSARSGFKAFKADGGIKSLNIGVGLNYQIDKNWSANAGVTFQQLRGSAAKSPITEQKRQANALLGVSYAF